MTSSVTVDLNFEKFLEAMRSLIREELDVLSQKPKVEKYYTRKEAAKLLRISLPTFHDWVRKGIIKPYKPANKILISESEIVRVLESRQP